MISNRWKGGRNLPVILFFIFNALMMNKYSLYASFVLIIGVVRYRRVEPVLCCAG